MRYLALRNGFSAVLTLTVAMLWQSFAAAGDIVDTAVEAGSFKTLVAAVQAAGLVDALKGEGPLTVLAPTDEAFAKLPAGTVETLLKPENKQQLIDILTFHVIPIKARANDVRKLDGVKSLNGQQIEIGFADAALTANGAKIVATDVDCSNGVIHVIDSVILPATDNIPTVATKAGAFNTLLAAAKAAGLVDALSADGPLTVFAPTDEAFAKLPAGTIDSLLKPENKQQLADILKYHVVKDRVYSADAVAAKKAQTLQGNTINVSVSSAGAKINNANLVQTDIDASNGVIHIIDSVLMPPTRVVTTMPSQMIQDAIAHGAPIYNAGHHGQCAQIYMDTANQIMGMPNHGLTNHESQTLQMAVRNAMRSSSMTARAWTMRRALDSAYVSLRNRGR